MSEVDHMTLLMSLQREIAEMKRRNEEVTQKKEDEILTLQKENEEMRRKLGEGEPSIGPTNFVDRSFTTPIDPKTIGEPKDKVHTQEVDGESYSNKSAPTTDTMDSICQHPFTDAIIGVPLPDKWKDFNRDHYDDTTDPNEHMDAYTTHMTLYTPDDAVLFLVFPTLLKGGALSWFTKLPPNSIDSFATLVSKFETQFATSRPHHLTSIALVGICKRRESP